MKDDDYYGVFYEWSKGNMNCVVPVILYFQIQPHLKQYKNLSQQYGLLLGRFIYPFLFPVVTYAIEKKHRTIVCKLLVDL